MRRQALVKIFKKMVCAVSGNPLPRLCFSDQEDTSDDVIDPGIIPERLECLNDIDKCLNYLHVNGGIFGLLEAGYGSKHDGEVFLIGLTDQVVDELVSQGKLVRLPLRLPLWWDDCEEISS